MLREPRADEGESEDATLTLARSAAEAAAIEEGGRGGVDTVLIAAGCGNTTDQITNHGRETDVTGGVFDGELEPGSMGRG